MTPPVPIAALFVRADSIYKSVPGVDCWDAERNALLWPGGCPVVAHPPCRTWGKLAAFATRAPTTEYALGLWAIDQVRQWGGVLEHPEGSRLFAESGCNPAGGLPDQWGGMTISVDQFQWGHRARKRTMLYVVGFSGALSMPHRAGKPTHVVSSGYGVRSNPGHSHRSALPECTKSEREATPPAFAAWLVELARKCVK
jgi:hypothetical protein